MQIRQLTPSDAQALRALWAKGLAQHPNGFLLTPEEFAQIDDAGLAARISGALTLGAFVDDQLQGFAMARRGTFTRLRHTADIGPVYVNGQMQGQGIGQGLMAALLSQLKAQGAQQAELTVDEANHSACALYHKLGFFTFGRRPRSVIIDGQPRHDLLMVVALDGHDLRGGP